MGSPRTTTVVRLATVGLAAALGATVLPLPAAAAATTVRISVNRAGVPGDGPANNAAVSADGRFVTFSSSATNLVPGDTNGFTDLFLRDRVANTIERVNVSSTGAQANDGSALSARVSPDGRFVTFSSFATNLAPGGTGGMAQIYLRDRTSRTTRRVSVSNAGAAADGNSFTAAVSANGRYVAFGSFATNVVGGDTNSRQDIFVRDVRNGTTRLVSVARTGRPQSNGESSFPQISNDGRFVGFLSDASNLQSVGTGGVTHAYVKDLVTGAVDLASVSAAGTPFSRGAGEMSMSADGRLVAFSNNELGSTGSQAYVRDRTARTTIVASRGSTGRVSDGPVSGVSISAGGRYVAFISGAAGLIPGSPSGTILIRDLRTATTIAGGVTSAGGFIDGAQFGPSMSDTGVAFDSLAAGIAPGGDSAHPFQVYFHQL